MGNFSIIEVMIVTLVIALTSAAIVPRTDENAIVAIAAALCLGILVSGPPLMWWRMRRDLLVGKWGLGEILWFWCGCYFAVFILRSLFVPFREINALGWLVFGSAIGGALFSAALLIRGAKTMTSARAGVSLENARPLFGGRWTNIVGSVLGFLLLTGAFLMLMRAFS